jgi:hypothetical protein
MELIQIKTLVDITNTRVTRPNQGTQLALDQNKNFITLMQCIEIRSIVTYDMPPTVETVDVKGMGFGSEYKGKHKVWTFTIRTDRDGVYIDPEGNPVGKLVSDLNNVPVIKSLTETINIDRAIFECADALSKNTIITALLGN